MIALLQRVTRAHVSVEQQIIGEIERGILALIAVEKNDSDATLQRMLERLLGYRLFADDQGKMNLNVKDAGGGLLLVPQFTLAADTRKGMRPSFASAAPPDFGKTMFEKLLHMAEQHHSPVAGGLFGADMQVSLVNDGPVTFWLHVQGDKRSG